MRGKCESESRSVVSDSLRPHGLYNPWNSPGQNTKAGIPSLADLPDPGIKPGSPALQADSLPTKLVWEVYILTEMVVTWVYPFVKTKQNVHFK